MISRPKVIVLDEPTSGLDSSKAAKILRILKKMAMKGQTIIFTIHQPSYLIYSCLDRLLLLDKGRTIYQGSAALIGSYMQTLSISVPTNSTISDFFMMEISTYKKDTMNYFTPLTQENYSKHLD
jgi:ABC-type multidrug transport system ATPase subunit